MFTKNLVNENRTFILYNFEQDDACVKWANETATNKVLNTVDTWQRRSKVQRYTDIMLGDLAKNIVKKYLLFLNPELEAKLIEYDRIRTDKFKNRDLFDLKIGNRVIEVKSSAEKYTKNLTQILNGRRIIINVGNVHEHDTDFIIQVFFVPNDLTFFKGIENINPNQDLEIFSKKFCDDLIKNTKPYICGWADKDMQLKAKQELFSVENNSTDATKRNYANVLLINSIDIEHLSIN